MGNEVTEKRERVRNASVNRERLWSRLTKLGTAGFGSFLGSAWWGSLDLPLCRAEGFIPFTAEIANPFTFT